MEVLVVAGAGSALVGQGDDRIGQQHLGGTFDEGMGVLFDHRVAQNFDAQRAVAHVQANDFVQGVAFAHGVFGRCSAGAGSGLRQRGRIGGPSGLSHGQGTSQQSPAKAGAAQGRAVDVMHAVLLEVHGV
jgi:hypothetical protein